MRVYKDHTNFTSTIAILLFVVYTKCLAREGEVSITVVDDVHLKDQRDEDGFDETMPNFPNVQELNNRLTERARESGFELQTHEVWTEDGYAINVHRLYKTTEGLKSPVLFMHGINGCSANYVVYRPSLAFYLAERGYDVWVGNSRGTAFSRKQKNMKRNMSYKKKEYWKISWHEMGYYDLPALLSRIKLWRGDLPIHYVGYSMGTTMFLVMASTRPEYLDYIASISLIAPVARPQHFDLIKMPTNRIFFMLYFEIVNFIGHGNIFKYRKSISSAMYALCSAKNVGKICEWFFRALSIGPDIFDFVNSLETFIFFPCGTSTRSYQHFIQVANAGAYNVLCAFDCSIDEIKYAFIKETKLGLAGPLYLLNFNTRDKTKLETRNVIEGKFQEYDYGKRLNKKKYKSKKPPEYDLASIDRTIYLLVGGEDTRADKTDIQWLHDRLLKPVYITKDFEEFDHRDFEYSIKLDRSHETILSIIEGTEKGEGPKIDTDVLIREKWPEELGVVKRYLS